MVDSAKSLRRYILEKCSVNQIINLAGYSFEGVNVETIIIVASKNYDSSNKIDVLLSNSKAFIFSHKRNQIDFEKNENFAFKVFSNEISVALTKKLKKGSEILDDLVLIKAGLQAYEKNKGIPKQTAEEVKSRPYDYTFKFDEQTYKYLEGKDVGRYFTNWSGLYLKYGEHLAAPRTINLFDGEKIIIREITGKYPNSIISTYNKELYLYNRSNIGIINKEGKNISLKYILTVLNSKLIAYYFVNNTAKSVRKMFPKIILNDLRKFPFKEISKTEQIPFIHKADIVLSVNKDFQDLNNQFIELLKSKFTIKKPSKKLQNWHELEFGEFLKELEKARKKSAKENETEYNKLSLSEEAEWMQYFNEQKQKAQELKTEIDKTEKEIDQMVYELYGLTEEEIAIVEEANK